MRISDWSSDVCSSDLLPLPSRSRPEHLRHPRASDPEGLSFPSHSPNRNLCSTMFHFRSQLSSHLAAGSEPAVAIRRPREKQDILRTQKNLKNSEIKRPASLPASAGLSAQSQQLRPRPSIQSLILEM